MSSGLFDDDALPDPMVAPEADVRSFPSMLLDVRRLRDSDLASFKSADAFRANVLSWAAAWHQVPAGSLPDDDQALAYLCGFGRDLRAWRRVRDQGGLHGWVKCSDGRLYHPVVCEKVLAALDEKAARKSRTAAARAARESHSPQSPNPSGPKNQNADRNTDTPSHSDQPIENVRSASSVTSHVANVVAFPVTQVVTGSNRTELNVTEQVSKEGRPPSLRDSPPAGAMTVQDFPPLPAWLPTEAWNEFVAMRRRNRKPLTPYAVKLIIGKLTDFRGGGEDPAEVLNQSVMSNWTGVFTTRRGGGAPRRASRAEGVEDMARFMNELNGTEARR